jgi:hypothetical protein
MSRSDDGKPRSGQRNWWLAACVLVIPLAWVGTQTMDDEPLYAVNASSRPLHAAMAAAQTIKPIPMGTQASMRWHGAGDVRALFSAKGIDPGAGYGAPLLSGVHHGKGAHAKARDASQLSLGHFSAQEYQLAVTDAR